MERRWRWKGYCFWAIGSLSISAFIVLSHLGVRVRFPGYYFVVICAVLILIGALGQEKFIWKIVFLLLGIAIFVLQIVIYCLYLLYLQ